MARVLSLSRSPILLRLYHYYQSHGFHEKIHIRHFYDRSAAAIVCWPRSFVECVQRRRTIDTSDQRMKNNNKNTIINTKLVRWAMQWNGKNMLLIKLHEARIRVCNYALRLLGICCSRQRGKMQMTDATPELRIERIFTIN